MPFRPLRSLTRILLGGMVMACGTALHAQQLVDDFNRAASTTVGGGWTETETVTSGAQINASGQLLLGSTTGGRDFIVKDVSGLYGTALVSNTCDLTWAFCARTTNVNPSGFDGSNYGLAFVLAGSSSSLSNNMTGGQGYAVVLGQSGTTDPVRIVRYSNGLSSNAALTNVVVGTGAAADIGNEYLAVKVTYAPATNLWTLYVQVLTSGTFSSTDPTTIATAVGSATNSTYTSMNLPYTGAFWNHATSGTENAIFDNLYVPSSCAATSPTVDFASAGISVVENVGTAQTFQVNILPAAATPESMTITITNGTGAIYGTDYTTNPNGSGGSFTLNVPAGATSVSFTVTVLNDAVQETPATETVTFDITTLSSGLTAGSQLSSVLTILDDDAPPTVLGRGDLAIVGINANNSSGGCSPTTGEDLISFFCFKDIATGTTLDLTDNGYNSCTANKWNDNEGFVRMTRTGPVIPAGTVITFRSIGVFGPTNVSSVAPDALWSCQSFGGSFALNSGGDQIIILQGGVWTDPGGSYDATYTGGEFLYGFSTNGVWTPNLCNSQNSGLPVGSECFSMAPTSASDFAKFTGDIVTAKTQRQWLIAIDDPANWSSAYGTCSAYNSATPNWLSAPVLPIIGGGMVNGLWTGAKNTDWFDCRNWDDAQVPTATTNVVVNQLYTPNCVVGTSAVSTSTAAVCNTLTVRSNDIAKSLTVDNTRSLTVGGATLVQRLNAGSPCGITVQNGSTFTTGDLTLDGFSTGSQEAFFSNTAALNVVTVNGNLRIEDGGRLALTNGTLRVNGDFTNLNSEARFEDLNSTVIFGGSGAQSITTSGFEEYFHVLRVNKPANDLTLNNGVRIRANLDLLNGRIFESSSLLVMDATATATNTSDNSFVHGAVQKYGTTDFIYPVGKGSKFRPAALTSIAGSATDAFTVEYFAASPQTTFGNAKEPTLHHISDCEYWMISRSAGSANAYVTLSWDTPASCGVTSNATLDELRIARWDGSLWLDRGESDYSGTFLSGTLISGTLQTAFSPWTLASTTTNNPLPIQLLGFTATPEGPHVHLRWTTASETDNAFFTVERSADGTSFTPVLHQDGAGTSQGMLQYEGLDEAPLPGLSYYRLRQTDVDGASTVSDAVPVYFGSDAGAPLIVLYAGDGLYAMHGFATGSTLDLIDPTGRILRRERITTSGLSPLPVDGLTPGAYIVRITDGVRQQSTRFVLPIH